MNTQQLYRTEFGVERKAIAVEAIRNELGACVRITESVGSHRTTIIVPAAGVGELVSALALAKESFSGDDLSATGKEG